MLARSDSVRHFSASDTEALHSVNRSGMDIFEAVKEASDAMS
jgi:hypothetical protein